MLIFDIEANGLLYNVTSIHCLVIFDTETDQTLVFNDEGSSEPIVRGIQQLMDADCIAGHNIIGYDIPLIKEQFPDFEFQGELIDTLVLSRLFYPHIIDRDYERRPEGMPKKLYGRHSLEAWGYRLKCYKGEFGKQPENFKVYTPEMLDYCIQDTLVNQKLWETLQRRIDEYS